MSFAQSCVLLVLLLVLPHVAEAKAPPPQAQQAGYLTSTLQSRFLPSEVDRSGRALPGYAWYLRNFKGRIASADNVTFDDASMILNGDPQVGNSQIATAAISTENADRFVGTAFGGGGYFEAEMAFDAGQVIATGPKAEWPAFWGLSLETLAQHEMGRDHWPGQPDGFDHYIEVDFFEYGAAFYHGGSNVYGTDMHDWYGFYKKECPKGFCQYHRPQSQAKSRVPASTDFTRYHRYGFLWVPATPDQPGHAQHYFDDQPIDDPVVWQVMPADAAPPPDGKPWAFSILDQQHLVLILGSGLHEALHVRSVHVWQSSDSHNLHH